MQFVLIILPAILIFATGFIGQRTLGLEPRAISKMAVYLLMPALGVRTFYENKLTLSDLYLLVFALILCATLIFVVYVLSFWKKYDRAERSSLVLSSVFMNNGNYGTPVALYAFGEPGFKLAIILMVIQQILMSTVGVYFAARGSDQKIHVRDSFITVFKMPVLYGTIMGIVTQVFHWKIPEFLFHAIDLVADATVPTIMLVLGMQLATISVRNLEKEKLSYSLAIKLIIAPLIALAITSLLPLSPLEQSLMILMASMPTAANTTMFALQFNAKPEFVSSAALVSTLLSIVSLPFVLFLLNYYLL